mgnify:CR=1 FL=1
MRDWTHISDDQLTQELSRRLISQQGSASSTEIYRLYQWAHLQVVGVTLLEMYLDGELELKEWREGEPLWANADSL